MFPVFQQEPPYRFFMSDRRTLYVLNEKDRTVYVNGNLSPVLGLTRAKIEVLRLLADAHINFWNSSLRIRQSRRPFAVAYAVTAAFTDGLWKDILFPETTVLLEDDWTEINETTRRRRFELWFPGNYTGAINKYIVTDCRFVDHGAAFTARTIEPFFPGHNILIANKLK